MGAAKRWEKVGWVVVNVNNTDLFTTGYGWVDNEFSKCPAKLFVE